MGKRMLRKAGTALLTLTMTAGMITGLPTGVREARAENTPPDMENFATAADLMANYDLVDSTTEKPIQSVYFGQDGSGYAQEWAIAGKDAGVTGDNIILIAATPLGAGQSFQEFDGKHPQTDYPDPANCSYETAPLTVNVNHYGISKLRTALNLLEKDPDYFNTAEQGYMNHTTIYTKDTYNKVNYSTNDVLYAAYGEVKFFGDKYITVGTNSSNSLKSGLRIDMSNWERDAFWTRSPYTSSAMAIMARPGNALIQHTVHFSEAVIPVFNLNLTTAIFASAALAASPSTVSDGVLTEDIDQVFTIRYRSTGDETAEISPNGTRITIGGITKAAAVSGMYLVVQTSTGTYAKAVGSDTPTLLPGSLTDTLSSFDDAKVWLESTSDRITTAKEATKQTLAAPRASVDPGTYTENQTVALSTATSEAKIYYTLDGTEPTAKTGTEYTAPIAITGRDGERVATTIKAIAALDEVSTSVVEFTYIIDLPQKYAVNVQVEDDTYGTATASNATAAEGDIVTLTATTKTGYAFKEWTGLDDVTLSGDTAVTDKVVKFEMPAKDVTAAAVFEEVATYQLTVNGGTINGTTGEKRFEEGETPVIKATVPADQIFREWKREGGDAVIASPSNATTTVTMGKQDTVITAVCVDIKDAITRVIDLIIKKKPAKTTYKLNEEFNPAGLVVQAKGVASPSDAEHIYTLSENSDGYELDTSEFDSSEPGEYDIHVKYDFDNGEEEEQHFDKTFAVEVLDEDVDDEETYVSGIKIKAKPVKKTYYVGDEIDLTGLVVIAKQRGLDTGEAKEDRILAAGEYEVEYDFSSSGSRKVTVFYYDGGKEGDKTYQASFSVQVLKAYNADRDRDSKDSDDPVNNTANPVSPWVQMGTGVWEYKKADGSKAKSEWVCTTENGKAVWYRFDENAKMQTGLITDPTDGHIYYLDPASGRMATGWLQIDGVWYYFNEIPPMESGWIYDTIKKTWTYSEKGGQPLGMLMEGAVKES